ncbi:MAG TPA: glutamate-cysteine ligase family protein, partial [Polyangiaceae bacterium]|nr:glutamate-cysteine ligase family protein [Polyangiaceae bacterium]
REYLPQRGSAGLDMMQRTCTTQGNFDWHSEQDAMRKMRVALKLSPLMHAWFSNAPFKEGKQSELLSVRGAVWQNMDPARSGLLAQLWATQGTGYETYVEWALDAGMFLIWRDGQIIKNTGQTFRDFLQHGFAGHRATRADWRLHLGTLFPEVRLKNTLEVRSVDALPTELSMASLAVWTGILYDDQALTAADALLSDWDHGQIEAARRDLCARALHVKLLGRTGFEWAQEVFELAQAGLKRRARLGERQKDESVLLGPAQEILESRCVPAQRAIEQWQASGSMIDATAVHLPA